MQQGCPIAPQVIEAWQTISPATIPHVSPGSQALPQHGWSIPPQGGGDWHVPPMQMFPLEHVSPGQHGWLDPPQVTHVPAAHERPAWHTLSRQHGCSKPPHDPGRSQVIDGPQIVPSQHSLGALHASPSRKQQRLLLHE